MVAVDQEKQKDDKKNGHGLARMHADQDKNRKKESFTGTGVLNW